MGCECICCGWVKSEHHVGPSASFSRMILPHWLAVFPHPTCMIQDCAQTGFCKDEMVRLIHSELLAWCLGKQLRSCSSAGGSSHLAQEAAPVHVSLCPTIRGQQWTCAQPSSPCSTCLKSHLHLSIRDAI